MKLFSIMYESLSIPGRIAMFTGGAEDATKAHMIGMQHVNAQYGELIWTPRLVTQVDLSDVNSTVVPIEIQKSVPVNSEAFVDISKNWLLKTIIDNKDSELLAAVEKYLNGHEADYIKDKLKDV